MFNHADYEARAEAMKTSIQSADDQSWRLTVDKRYALFVTANASTKTAAIIPMFANEAHASDTTKFRSHYANELMQASHTLHLAASLLFGIATVGDPIGCEVIMRLHQEATTPKEA
jgi:hypothetical protein